MRNILLIQLFVFDWVKYNFQSIVAQLKKRKSNENPSIQSFKARLLLYSTIFPVSKALIVVENEPSWIAWISLKNSQNVFHIYARRVLKEWKTGIETSFKLTFEEMKILIGIFLHSNCFSPSFLILLSWRRDEELRNEKNRNFMFSTQLRIQYS